MPDVFLYDRKRKGSICMAKADGRLFIYYLGYALDDLRFLVFSRGFVISERSFTTYSLTIAFRPF